MIIKRVNLYYKVFCYFCEDRIELGFVVSFFVVFLESIRVDSLYFLFADEIDCGLINSPYVLDERFDVDKKYFVFDIIF